jgi:hypothetical protein
MVLRELKCVFVHIPKTGGTSIEKVLNPEMDAVSKISDVDLFVGWSDEFKIWMQHATMQQMNDLHREDLTTHFKFGFVRNPWDRAVSDYLWLLRDAKEISGRHTFYDYLMSRGYFRKIFKNYGSIDYRGDHILPQVDFLFDKNGNSLVDFIGKTEDFEQDVNFVCDKIGIQRQELPYEKKSDRKQYLHYYSNATKEIVAEKYAKDIEHFGYKFGE